MRKGRGPAGEGQGTPAGLQGARLPAPLARVRSQLPRTGCFGRPCAACSVLTAPQCSNSPPWPKCSPPPPNSSPTRRILPNMTYYLPIPLSSSAFLISSPNGALSLPQPLFFLPGDRHPPLPLPQLLQGPESPLYPGASVTHLPLGERSSLSGSHPSAEMGLGESSTRTPAPLPTPSPGERGWLVPAQEPIQVCPGRWHHSAGPRTSSGYLCSFPLLAAEAGVWGRGHHSVTQAG